MKSDWKWFREDELVKKTGSWFATALTITLPRNARLPWPAWPRASLTLLDLRRYRGLVLVSTWMEHHQASPGLLCRGRITANHLYLPLALKPLQSHHKSAATSWHFLPLVSLCSTFLLLITLVINIHTIDVYFMTGLSELINAYVGIDFVSL